MPDIFRFARVTQLADVLSKPPAELTLDLTTLRETQALNGDVVRVLAESDAAWTEIETACGVKGWIRASDLHAEETLTRFERAQGLEITNDEFFKAYAGAPYLAGGLSPLGIDCSGLMQRYFCEVHDKQMPRNSRQQRSLIRERKLETVQNGDLVFAREKENGRHHVGLYLYSSVWHSDSREGVVRHLLARFEELYEIEAIGSLK